MRPRGAWLAVSALLLLGSAGCSVSPAAAPASTDAGSKATVSVAGDAALARAFEQRTSNLEVEGEGRVVRVLSDDTQGDRHQRFIVELASGQTLLITHNIDVAPRVAPLEVGDRVSFKGVYEWNEEGGLVHWTHLDPNGSHEAGWIKAGGRTYQ
jgi:Protein of unknown function (DUF3465)